MEIVVFILYLFGLCLLIFRNNFFTVEGIKKPLLVFLWGLKLIVGVGFFVVFNSYTPYKDACYSEDFFKSSEKLHWLHKREPALFTDIMLGVHTHTEAYKEETQRISYKWHQWNENQIVSNNRTVIRINALLYFISFRFYSIHLLFMCFLSFVGSVLLFKAFPKRGTKEIYASTVACFLVPSLIFWSVGVLKEPLMLLGLGGFLFYFRKIRRQFSFLTLLLFILSSLLLLSVNALLFAIVLPMIVVFFWGQAGHRFLVLKYVVPVVLLSTICLLSHSFFPEKPIDAVHWVSVQNQQRYNLSVENNKRLLLNTPHLDGSIESFAKNTPLALCNSISTPFVRPIDNFVKLFVNFETIILALLLIVCLIFGNYRRFLRNNFAIFSLIVCFYGFLLIGLTTHDMEMMMRSKSIFLPFYVYALIHLLDTDKVLYVLKIRKKRKHKNFDLAKSFEERMAKRIR
ncbi:MAG: hypothetical protein FWH36_02030 [Lentimicrobiaceae bacterium]|nr:hypothetical protein [Lentimicrobiaceae bacterium]